MVVHWRSRIADHPFLQALEDALAVEEKCPLTRKPLKMEDCAPNRALQDAAEAARVRFGLVPGEEEEDDGEGEFR